MKAGSQSRQPKQPEQLSSQSGQAEQPEQTASPSVLPEQKQPVAACLTLRDWVCCWSAMNSSLPPDCNAWKVIARLQ